MKVFYAFSNYGGSEILQVKHASVVEEIYSIITNVKFYNYSKKEVSQENVQLKTQFSLLLLENGFKKFYSNDFTNHNDSIEMGRDELIYFIKDSVLLKVQFGKYFSMFCDMAKFQYFFNESKAEVGIEIVPCHPLYRQMSSGVSYGEQLVYDIERLKRHFPAVPVKVILIAPDEFDLKKIYK